ncbi:PaaX family transcriptional regulator [Microbacterium sp. STN6]|uniref:PaaX family transcriptional regulator n=1 Tax=Microbacterium sp. STN6 TaxID=2995588 RepID=UPI002260D978|nr:PaaX family transcriptional regulator C-terminal domain-containing protein [Microbacterium sp. STN6]MCX7523291.1 PaaX family transcriptional regulator [Microbacterium sp. STN6]
MASARVVPDSTAQAVVADSGSADSQHPQHLLLTLLGDYWMSDGAIVPSGALVDLLSEFGITQTGARAALSRLSKRGLLSSNKEGRRTFYRLTEHARHVLTTGLERIVSFGADPQPWDGQWTCVAFSVPEQQRTRRHQLRVRLRWLGFAPLYDGVWVSPRSRAGEATSVLEELSVGAATVLVGPELASGTEYGRPIDAWDLSGVREQYLAFIERMRPIRSRLAAGDVSGSEALQARTRVMDEWRWMPNADPELPDELLPREWPRADARALFRSVYDGLGEPAAARVREIVSCHAPEFAEHVSAHTVSGIQ